MSAVLPGARGLFSVPQAALPGTHNRIRLSRRIFETLNDFRLIATTLQERPTRFRELVPVGQPVAVGACDASQRGMGGVWFSPEHPPILWRAAFPAAVQRELVTSTNRKGSLSISDLELAGTVAHKHVISTTLPSVAERLLWLTGDNRASLSWASKGSATSTAARSYILRLNTLHQRHFRYVARHDFIAGKDNVMAHQKVGFDNYNHNWLYITQFMQFFVTYERCFLFTH